MKASIASTYIYTIIIIFMVIIFAFIMGTIVYYKSFKINKSILSIIEKYEGYNELSISEIDTQMESIGYNVVGDGSCPKKNGVSPLSVESKYKYCIYYYDDTDTSGNPYYSYGVTTYVSIDFPIFNIFLKLPVYSKSNPIYKFAKQN